MKTKLPLACRGEENVKEKEALAVISNRRIQTAKWGYIVSSALLCTLGVGLIAVPDFSISLLCWIAGLLLILFGLVKIVGYCSKDLYRLAFQYDLAFGILLIALGLIFLLRSDTMVNMLWLFLGIVILADALLKVQISIDSKAFGIPQWWLILMVAAATGIVGFLLIFHPSESARAVMILLGVSLLLEGILNLITSLTAVKIIRSQGPVVIDAEYNEVDESDPHG